MRWIVLAAILTLSGCEVPESSQPTYDAHVRDFQSAHQERTCTAGMRFGGGMGVPLGGCGTGLVMGFDGKIGFGFSF